MIINEGTLNGFPELESMSRKYDMKLYCYHLLLQIMVSEVSCSMSVLLKKSAGVTGLSVGYVNWSYFVSCFFLLDCGTQPISWFISQ